MVLSRPRAALTLLLLAVSCQDRPPTALVSAFAADETTLGRAHFFRLVAERGSVAKYDRTFPRDQFVHPASLTFRDASDGDRKEPLRVRFEGYATDPSKPPGAQPIIAASARLAFVKEKTKLLRLGLSQECLDKTCASADLTCRHGECVPDVIDDPDTELPDTSSGDDEDTLDPTRFDDLPPAAGGAAGVAGVGGVSGLGGVGGVAGLGGIAGLGGEAGLGGLSGSGGASGVAGEAGMAGLGGAAGVGGGEAGAAGTAGGSADDVFPTHMTLGGRHTCALLAQGMKCWGDNSQGQLGFDQPASQASSANVPYLEFTNAAGGVAAGDVAAGDLHTCAFLADSSIRCWGRNAYGQLGLGKSGIQPSSMSTLTDVNVGSLVPTALFVGGSQSCILRQEDAVQKVSCWGLNDNGALGLGGTHDQGLKPGDMGNSLKSIDLGLSFGDVKSVGIGNRFACALSSAPGKIKCWGHNDKGQLGLGTTDDRGDKPGEMGTNLPAVDLGAGHTAKALAVGDSHACALLDGGSVKCWGLNDQGQLGLGDTMNRGDQANTMVSSLPTIDLGKDLVAEGIVAGANHTCVLLNTKSVKCWGHNLYGQLGLGFMNNRGDSAGQMGANLHEAKLGTGVLVMTLHAGSDHTCARLTNKRVKCWGRNNYGQLGLGDLNNRGSGDGQMGEDLHFLDFE